MVIQIARPSTLDGLSRSLKNFGSDWTSKNIDLYNICQLQDIILNSSSSVSMHGVTFTISIEMLREYPNWVQSPFLICTFSVRLQASFIPSAGTYIRKMRISHMYTKRSLSSRWGCMLVRIIQRRHRSFFKTGRTCIFHIDIRCQMFPS